MAKEAAPIEALEAFIDRHERQAQDAGVVVVQVAYPGAQSRVYPGRYAGINVVDGNPAATYSDGSKNT